MNHWSVSVVKLIHWSRIIGSCSESVWNPRGSFNCTLQYTSDRSDVLLTVLSVSFKAGPELKMKGYTAAADVQACILTLRLSAAASRAHEEKQKPPGMLRWCDERATSTITEHWWNQTDLVFRQHGAVLWSDSQSCAAWTHFTTSDLTSLLLSSHGCLLSKCLRPNFPFLQPHWSWDLGPTLIQFDILTWLHLQGPYFQTK